MDPLCSLVAQRYRDEVRVLDEIVLHRATTEQLCEEFEKKFGRPQGGVEVFGDANGAAEAHEHGIGRLRGDTEVLRRTGACR